MARFGQRPKSVKPVTYEGGRAYEKSVEDEWANYLTSYLFQKNQPSFYENASEKEERFKGLTEEVIKTRGPMFVCKAAVFSRNVLGLRSVSTFVAAILNGHLFDGKRDFFRAFFHRPDDVSELFSAIDEMGGRRSHAMIRGAADYLSALDDYRVGKYKMQSRQYNMYDLIRLTHATSDSINRYIRGELELPDTWEVRISTAKDKETKEAEWRRLVEEQRLGYMALIRNLRNILDCSFVDLPWIETVLIPQIRNERLIRKSMVYPYQIYNAWKNLDTKPIELTLALSDAFKKSVNNIPHFDGRSLIVLDVSGSMEDWFSKKSNLTIKEVCAVYATALYLSDSVFDFYKFGDKFGRFEYKKFDNVFDIIERMQDNDGMGYGTDIIPLIDHLDTHYDRVFLFSDMQVMNGRSGFAYAPFWMWSDGYGNEEDDDVERSDSAFKALDKYEERLGDTTVYSFDLGNYKTQLSPRGDIKYVTALNDKVISLIPEMEKRTLAEIISDYDF